ncbi:MAG TPA: hypothetical protein DDY78_14490 [Planctomycetales bacterium]|nr:hypothetical protein [Planctomycetales bacterium]
METSEYLVSHGCSGDFGRFRPTSPATYRRGDRVVLRSPDGLELGVVLRPATEGHARFLSGTALGELLRRATAEDEDTIRSARDRGDLIFQEGRLLAAEMGLPVEILDVEVQLDGSRAVVHHIRLAECDYRPLVSTLSTKHRILIVMENLGAPAAVPEEAHGGGCGKAGCGQAGGGGCGSCGSGGGCATGCGSGGAAVKDEAGTAVAVRDLPDDHEVCTCWSVAKEVVVAAIREGVCTVEAVGETTRAGTGCESCQPLLQQLIDSCGPAGLAEATVGSEEDAMAYFSGLREKMWEGRRTPLL